MLVTAKLPLKVSRKCFKTVKAKADSEGRTIENFNNKEKEYSCGVAFRFFVIPTENGQNCRIARVDHQNFLLRKDSSTISDKDFSKRTSYGTEQYCYSGISNSNLTPAGLMKKCSNYGEIYFLYQADKKVQDIDELPSAETCNQYFPRKDYSISPSGTNKVINGCVSSDTATTKKVAAPKK